jgi:acetoin:2,6-dichlorophenolindophenol oxidoreductase subunit beta
MHTNAASEILRVLDQNLRNDPKFLITGLGVTDPKGVFGTTLGLVEKYGNKRVLETPTSENAMTGVGVGLAIAGYRPLMIHQRLDFFILAMDQLVNSAAKWHYMFGGQNAVPMTIRLITGRGWGQGPTHSQNLHSWFAHIPGLKVVMPSFASDVAALLQASIDDPNPVVFIEDRWIHNQQIDVNDERLNQTIELGKAKVCKSGDDITIISSGYMSIESLKAVNYLHSIGISAELIDLRTIKPLDMKTILTSVRKTKNLLVVDAANEIASFGKEIIANTLMTIEPGLQNRPQLVSLPDVPEPTSYGVIGQFRVSAAKIAQSALQTLCAPVPDDLIVTLTPLKEDVPDEFFTGPF